MGFSFAEMNDRPFVLRVRGKFQFEFLSYGVSMCMLLRLYTHTHTRARLFVTVVMDFASTPLVTYMVIISKSRRFCVCIEGKKKKQDN